MKYEYRVIDRKAKGMLGDRMRPESLAKLLNEHASQGWELDRIIDNEGYASMSIGKNVFYLIFRRPAVALDGQ